jgi:two-component system sensor histidine kinase KdpD
MRRAPSYLWTVAFVGLVTAVGIPLRGTLADPDVVMLYLLAIGAAAARFGRRPSVVAAALSVLGYDFFFVAPYHTFRIADQHYVLTFVMMFAVGLVSSGIAVRVRQGEVEAMRSALLSTVSHDLRTPLAAITGAATTLRDASAELTPGQRTELLDAICEEAERLERLVSNLLEMTRVEAGALQVKRDWVPLEEIVGSALARVEPLLGHRSLTTDLPATLPLVSVDPVLLEHVFVNLIENAAKYSPAGAPIDVSARVAHGAVEAAVADRGPGIPEAETERLFEKFTRGPHPGVPGAGLGLAICRGVVEAHGGTLSYENRSGGGALFRIRLPLTGGAAPSIKPEPRGRQSEPGQGRR